MFYKIGLVLSGGGGKGSYEVGVFKALKELGIMDNIKAVSGTSVGALNAAALLQNNLELIEKMWLSINADQILSIKSGNIINRLKELNIKGRVSLERIKKWEKNIANHGIYSRLGLTEIINNNLNFKAISSSPISCFVTAAKLPTLEVSYFSLNGASKKEIISLLLASSALPGIFPPENIGKDKYVDGGMNDNTPVKPLYDLGCNLIIIVYLNRGRYIDFTQFPLAKIIEIIPSEDQGGLISGTLNFNPEIAKKRIEQGYHDTKKILEPLSKLISSFYDFYQDLSKIRHEELCYKEIVRDSLSKNINIKDEILNIFNH